MSSEAPLGRGACFQGRVVDGTIVTAGTPAADLGHRIDLGPSRGPGGNWARWRYDGEVLAATTDRYGAYPLFYAGDGSSIAVSPSIDCLLGLGVERVLDFDALAVFLAVGYYVGADTPFVAIRAMPPDGTLTWKPGRLQVDGRRVERSAADMTRAEARAGVAELTRDAVGRSIADTDHYLMPVSGGRDSRHLLLELVDAGHPPARAVTAHHHPAVWGGDVPFAADLCAGLGVEHEIVSPGPLVLEEWRKNRETSYCSDEHAWYRPVARALNGATDHTFDGLAGGTSLALSGFYYPKLRRLNDARRWDDLAAEVGRKLDGEPRFAALIAPHVRDRINGERASARIRADLDEHLGEPEPYLASRFWSRTTRELNLTSTLMLDRVASAYTPFMDPDLLEFAWSIPVRHLDEAFHDEVIAARFPDPPAVPYTPGHRGQRPRPARAYMRSVNRDLAGMLRRHSDGSLVDRVTLLRRARLGSLTGDDWYLLGRRWALLTYLVQLESIVAGRGPSDIT